MNAIKGFFAGSGLGAFSDRHVIERLLLLTGRYSAGAARVSAPVRIAYLGTATYDLPEPELKQTSLLRQLGCEVTALRVADPAKAALDERECALIERSADIILVSGGNTLYAIRRWEETGLAEVLRRTATARPVILAGGSAGAICWFISGHSDSADPSTYMKASLLAALGQNAPASLQANKDTEEEEAKAAAHTWQYIRVHGLDILPGLVCPHYDVTQDNGIPRARDFARMLRRHPSERGIGIDHWAVLILQGDGRYEVFSVPGKTRHPSLEGSTQPASGQADGKTHSTDAQEAEEEEKDDATLPPSVFVLDVVDGTMHRTRIAAKGAVQDLLRAPRGPLLVDPFESYYAMENPTPSSGALLRQPMS